VRVIAGRFGGRRLEAPPGQSTRPTADRVREALFSILGDISGTRVLDLFAGSGALGIEALSRGAADADFVEGNARAVRVIRRNLDALGVEARVYRRDVFAWLGGTHEVTYDLVFADPPYSSASRTAARLSELLPAVLNENSLIVTESHKRNPLELATAFVDARDYGETRIAIYRGR
jgi:16S rRNA (guanine966-N2)-methyltransferase